MPKLSQFKVEKERVRSERFQGGLKVLERLSNIAPRNDDGSINWYKVGRSLHKMMCESKEIGDALSGVDGDVQTFFVKKALESIVDNPGSFQESALAQFLLGSELIPKILSDLGEDNG